MKIQLPPQDPQGLAIVLVFLMAAMPAAFFMAENGYPFWPIAAWLALGWFVAVANTARKEMKKP